MQPNFNAVLTALFCSLFVVGCVEGLNSTHNDNNEKVNAMASCEYFKATWCAPNLASASTVCEGIIFNGDMMFPALQTVSNKNEACAISEPNSQSVPPPDSCANAVLGTYSDLNSRKSQVLICLSGVGETLSVEGSIAGTPIKAIRP